MTFAAGNFNNKTTVAFLVLPLTHSNRFDAAINICGNTP